MSDLQYRGPILGSSGGAVPFTADETGAQRVADARARYAGLARTGSLFFACNQAAIAASAGLSTAAKILTLYNPFNSGKNVELVEIIVSMTTLPGTSTTVDVNVFLSGNLTPTQAAPSSVTAETVQCCLLGGAAGVAKAYNTCTLAATPVAIRPLASTGVLTAVGTSNFVVKDEVAGALILAPGIYVTIEASAGTMALQCSMTWAEIPIFT